MPLSSHSSTYAEGTSCPPSPALTNIGFNDAGMIRAASLAHPMPTRLSDGTGYIDFDTIAGVRYLKVSAIQDVQVSPSNSSTANIASGASFTGVSHSTLGVAAIQVCIFADQNCTIQVRQAQEDPGANWNIIDTWNYTANSTSHDAARTFQAMGASTSIVVTNTGGSTTTVFRLTTVMCPDADSLPRGLTQLGNLRCALFEVNGAIPSATNPLFTSDQVRALIAAGKAWRATTTMLATGGNNTFVGFMMRANNLAVNVVVYNITVTASAAATDGRIYYNTTGANTDSGLTVNLLTSNTSNQIVGGSAPALGTLLGSPPSTSQTTGMGGTGAITPAIFSTGSNAMTTILNTQSQIWLPKSTDRNCSVYLKMPSSSTSCGFTVEWVEF